VIGRSFTAVRRGCDQSQRIDFIYEMRPAEIRSDEVR